MAVFDFLKDKMEKSARPTTQFAPMNAPAPTPAPAQEETRRLAQLAAESIRPNPNQPRKSFDDDTLEELADSIRQVGLIQPLVVRRMDGYYELVAGERRLRACKLLGLAEIPCIVQQDVYEEDSAMMALIENLQRENLHYLEEAECYAALISTYGLKQEELAERLGKSQSSIANKLRVLRLSPAVKKAMTEARMTERHARALLRIRDEATQLSLVEKVKQRGLSVKDTEMLVDKTLNRMFDEKQDGAAPRPKVLRYLRDTRLFTNTVSAACKQLTAAGMDVQMEQNELDDGTLEIRIRVKRSDMG